MLFSSLSFLYAFLPLTIVLYYLCPGRKSRNALLLAASLVFYAWGEPRCLLLMPLLSFAVWLCGLAISGPRQALRRLGFFVSLLLLLGSLLLFKYLHFFAGMIGALTARGFRLPEILLPLGISFYVFQMLSYCIDLRRGSIESERSFPRFLLYVSLFPQFIQGPIVRFSALGPEIADRHESWDEASAGARRFMIGLAKKTLLADQLAVLVDAIYGAPALSGTAAYWLAAVCYTLQIYHDFSGYSDMAVGLGLLFGFHLPENFRYPYCASSIRDFWRRWHITLSFWFRDYVYIPLGGNRVKAPRFILNLLIVWGLTGLWHGASWNFVLWGLYYGVLLILERFVAGDRLERVPIHLRRVFTFVLVTVGWVLFRLTDMDQLRSVLTHLFVYQPTNWRFLLMQDTSVLSKLPAVPLGLLFSFPIMRRLLPQGDGVASSLLRNGGCLVLLALSTVFLVSSSFHPFLYFNF